MPPVLWSNQRPGIMIDGGDSFVIKTRKALDTIAAGPIGRALLDTISKRCQGIGTAAGKSVIIRLGQGTLGGASSLYRTNQQSLAGGDEVRRAAAAGSHIRLAGSGQSSEVQYNPNVDYQYMQALGIPAYVALAHELIHALHAISGDVVRPYSWNNGGGGLSSGGILEEARTVGLGRFANMRFTENRIRAEHELPPRTYYAAPGDCDNLQL